MVRNDGKYGDTPYPIPNYLLYCLPPLIRTRLPDRIIGPVRCGRIS